MNMHLIDWAIIVILLLLLYFSAWFCRRFMKGVSCFLVAGRNVGRYLGLGSDAMQGLGAITILAGWQYMYKAGFSAIWWGMMAFPVSVIIALTGFGIYRWRQTRAMTMGQLIEMRYSRNFRIFFGFLAFFSGVVNMGIFPVVGANFFIYFCGIPTHLAVLNFSIPTVFLVILILESIAVAICLMGGQVTLIVTDFLQSLFVNFMLIVIVVILYRALSWKQTMEAFQSAPNSGALLHPFKSEGVSEFNVWFFLLQVFWMMYLVVVWAPNTMQLGSARDAHEARMMKLIGILKGAMGVGLGLTIMPLAAFAFMHHPDFAEQASRVENVLSAIDNPHVKSQMIVPAAIGYLLPSGIIGMFAAVVLFAHISTNNTYYLAWGGMFIQDVLNPILGWRLDPQKHVFLLRISVIGVAIFVILFSLLFRQVDNIVMFFAVTGAIFTSGAGVVVLGALYWRRAATRAAWIAMISGAVLSLAGMILRSILGDKMLHGQWVAFLASAICISLFIVVSLIERKKPFDLKGILHEEEQNPAQIKTGFRARLARFWDSYPVDRFDKILCILIAIEAVLWAAAFLSVCFYNLSHDVPVISWMRFFKVWLVFNFFFGIGMFLWISLGGIRDLSRLFKALASEKIDESDDGIVNDKIGE